MRDNKKYQLLKILQDNKSELMKSKILASMLNVSSRQIRNYIIQINNEFGESVVCSSASGYFLNPHFDVHKLLRTQDLENEDNPLFRQIYIIQKLLSEPYVDIFMLTEELFVSYSTIQTDIRKIKHILIEYNLTLKNDVKIKNNIILCGKEQNKRNLITHLIHDTDYYFYSLDKAFSILSHSYPLSEIKKIVQIELLNSNLFTNDYSLNTLTLHLMILIDRVRNLATLVDNHNLETLLKTESYNASRSIMDIIEQKFSIEITQNECLYYALIVLNNTSEINFDQLTRHNLNQFIDKKYIDIANHCIADLSKTYHISEFNEDFAIKFTLHLQNAILRIENNYLINNPLTDNIKLNFPLIYDMAVFIAMQLNNNYNILLNEHEITFVALHIGSFFEDVNSSNSKLKAIFVYSNYYNIHTKSIRRLQENFASKIDIVHILSVEEFYALRHYEMYDLVITTENLESLCPNIKIEALLDDKGILRVSKFIDLQIKKKKNTKMKNHLRKLFSSELFFVNNQYNNEFEVINFMTNQAIEKGFADNNFSKDVLIREELSATCYEGVALPHALSKNAFKNFLSVYISKDAIKWSNKQVNLVILIGLNQCADNIFSEIFDYLIEILTYQDNIKLLSECCDFESFINQIILLIDSLDKKANNIIT